MRSQAAASRGTSRCPARHRFPARRLLLCPAAVAAGSGGQLLPGPSPCALPQLLGQTSSRPAGERMAECGRSWSLLWAGAWLTSLVDTPPGWGRVSHPTCASRQHQEAGEDAWSGASRAGACFSPSPAVPSAARLWVPPHLWDRAGLALSLAVLRDHLCMPPPYATSVGIDELSPRAGWAQN